MKNNSTTPFGYVMVDGQIKIESTQATVVKEIFQNHFDGKTVTSIANRLKEAGIAYKENVSWNKNTVCRILSDSRYIGAKQYPAIIEEQIFFLINARKQVNTAGKLNPAIRIIRDKIVCEKCSSSLIRVTHIYRNKSIAWSCRNCDTRTIGLFDEDLVCHVETVIDNIIAQPEIASCTIPHSTPIPLSLTTAERNWERNIANPGTDQNLLLRMAQDIASLQYQYCQAGEIEGNNHYLRGLIEQYLSNEISQSEFINLAIREIQLSPSGQITIKLINNKLL